MLYWILYIYIEQHSQGHLAYVNEYRLEYYAYYTKKIRKEAKS